jgi:protocatechuate 3,4-dioxygenase beta subunit
MRSRRSEPLVIAGAVALLLFAGAARLAAPGPDPGPVRGAGADRTAPASGTDRAEVQVRVVDAADRPLRGALVAVGRGAQGDDGPVVTARADAAGRATLEVRPAETCLVVITAEGQAREVRRVPLRRPGRHDLGKIRLLPEHVVGGRVQDPAGKPVPGATVWALDAFDLPQRPTEPPVTALADAAGRFRLRGLHRRVYQVSAQAPGHGLSVEREVPAPRLDLVITLPNLLAVTGTVTYQGSAAAGARVSLAGSGQWPPATTLTDAAGRFSFPAVREGLYELRAVHGRRLSVAHTGVEVGGKGLAAPLALVLVDGTEVRGRVIDATSRQGVAAARLSLAEDLLALTPTLGVSDASGLFVLGPLLPGEYLLQTDAAGYLPRQGVPVTVVAGTNPALELALERGAEISGVVLDDLGRPVADARLEVVGRARGSHVADRTTQMEETRDRLWAQALAPEAPAPAAGAAPGFLGVTSGPIPRVPTVDTPGDLSGVDLSAPLTGARAEGLQTDAQGRFRVRGLPPGSLTLVVRHADLAQAKAGPFRVTRGEVRADVIVRMRPGLRLEGQVLDPQQVPIAGVQVAVARPEDAFHLAVRFTDAAGRFEIPNLSGPVRLTLSAPGYVDRVHRVDLPDSAPAARIPPVRIALDRADCEISGVVVDDKGLAVAEARVELASVTPDAPGRAAAYVDEAGRFALLGLGRMTYRLTVRHADYPPLHQEIACPATPRLALRLGGGLAFSVEDDRTGDPLPTFRYELRRPGGPVIRETGHAGRAEVVPVPAGTYHLSVSALGYADVATDVTVPAGTAPRQLTRRGVRLKLALAGGISGRVRDDQGFPVAEATVRVGTAEATTDREGDFRLEGVAPGTHEVVATHPDRGSGRTPDVEVVSGLGTTGVVIDLVAGQSAPRGLVATVAISLAEQRGQVRITRVAPGSQAESSGLAVGDELVAVDGQDLDGLGLPDVRGLLRGTAGAPVVLEVRRSGKVVRISVTREVSP